MKGNLIVRELKSLPPTSDLEDDLWVAHSASKLPGEAGGESLGRFGEDGGPARAINQKFWAVWDYAGSLLISQGVLYVL